MEPEMNDSNFIIKVEGLGKKYLIHHQKKERYTALRDVLADKAVRFTKRISEPFVKQKTLDSREEFWALKDISFKVKKGEVLGIIGRNGAGKSTLLKVLSRITAPTAGRIHIKGRVASLLEVGTGFHPELTGRENIFLNGAILGMSRTEIKKKFDEIVDFAEIEKFLDTPVKRYSSGMYVRLAFAVAAHLEPEILVVDEVLAVGDAQFQKKCLGKMGEVSQEGRTVFFVSHQMPSIQMLCNRAILLSNGSIVRDGEVEDVIQSYIHTNSKIGESIIDLSEYTGRTRSIEHVIKEAWLEDENGKYSSSFQMGSSLTIGYRFKSSKSIYNPGFGFGIDDMHGRRLFSANNYIMTENATTVNSIQEGTVNGTDITYGMVIAANLNEGDLIPPLSYGYIVNKTETRNYLGVSRIVNILETIYSSEFYDTHWLMGYDKASGIMLEQEIERTDRTPDSELPYLKQSMSVSETNIFDDIIPNGGTTLPLDIIIVVAVFLVGVIVLIAVLFLKKRSN